MQYSRATQLHCDLLNKEVQALKPDDLRFVRDAYAHRRGALRNTGNPLVDGMYEHLAELDSLLAEPEGLAPAVRDAVVAAMKYFLRDEDHISDDAHGPTGLVDDALVVQAAVNIVLGRQD